MLINCIVAVKLEHIRRLFPAFQADELQHQAVDKCYSPILDWSISHPHLTRYIVWHNVYIEPAMRLGGEEGDWLWTACMVLHSPISRKHVLEVAQNFPEIYEEFVKQKYNRNEDGLTCLRSHYA